MRHSLRLQLLAWVLTPLALLAGLNAGMSYQTALETANLVTDRTLMASARAIAEETRGEDGLLQAVVPPAALEMFDTGAGDFVYYSVADGVGHLLAGVADLPPAPGKRHGEASYEAGYRGIALRLYGLDHPLAGQGPDASVRVVIGTSLGGRDALVRRLWVMGFGQQMALLVTAGFFMVFGLKRGLAPLLRLRDEVRARPPTSLDPFEPEAVQAEIRPLVLAINQQILRVKAQLAAQHRFVTNAAHQLRTPLTVLQIQATYALRHRGAEQQAGALAAIHVGVGQMARLADQLLTLSRAEPGSRRTRQDHVVLGLLAARVLEGCMDRALASHVDLGLDERVANVAALGDETMMGEMLANLVDNALRYCPAGSRVTVSVDRHGEEAVLGVRDDGPGIPAGEADRIFERFYRLEGTPGSGSGLGLAIVKEVAEAAGGQVSARRPEGGGLLIEVRVPAVP